MAEDLRGRDKALTWVCPPSSRSRAGKARTARAALHVSAIDGTKCKCQRAADSSQACASRVCVSYSALIFAAWIRR